MLKIVATFLAIWSLAFNFPAEATSLALMDAGTATDAPLTVTSHICPATASSSSATITCTTTVDIAAGQTIVVVTGGNATAGATGVSDGGTNTYVVHNQNNNGSTDAEIWYVASASHLAVGATITVTWGSANTARFVDAFVITQTTTAVATQSATGSSTTPSCAVGGIAKGAAVFGAVILAQANDTITQPSGWKAALVGNVASASDEVSTGSIVTKSAAAQTYNPTGFTSGTWVCVVDSFSATTTYSGPGDVFSINANMWWGLRAYNNAIVLAGTQKIINTRRASDNETCDIIVSGTGGLGNTANCSGSDNGISVSSFCNSTTCFIHTMYDQSGNGFDMTQATNANQPTLSLTCIASSLPCATKANGSNITLGKTSSGTIAQPLTFETMSMRTTEGAAGDQLILYGDNGGPYNTVEYTNLLNQLCINVVTSGRQCVTAASLENNWRMVGWVENSTSSFLRYNGGNSANININSTAWQKGNMLIGNPVTNDWGGDFTDMGFWPQVSNTGVLKQLCNNEVNYWGTGGSC